MSLNWSVENVKYFQHNPDAIWQKYTDSFTGEYEDVNAETKALIFGTMAVGIGNLTISNAAHYYARWKIYEKFDDLYVYAWFEDSEKKTQHLTTDMIKKHIGLSTNVSYETKKSWLQRCVKYFSKREDIGFLPTAKQFEKIYDEFTQEFENSF